MCINMLIVQTKIWETVFLLNVERVWVTKLSNFNGTVN